MKSYDLVVSGGGLSGVAAAVSAAREGLSVLLIERYGFLGGMATAGLVNPFMDYTLNDGSNELVNSGLFSVIIEELDDMGGLKENRHTFNEEIIKLVLDRLVKKYNVELLFHTYVTSVSVEGELLKSISIANKSGQSQVFAKYFVDATGDADISAYAGCEFEVGREEDSACQPMTLCFRIGNVDKKKISKEQMQGLYNEFQGKGLIKNKRENILSFPHMIDDVLHLNSTRIIGKSPLDAWDLTATEIEAREQVYELYTFLRDNVEGFENSHILMSAPQTGARESRRIKGKYTITQEDLLSCTKFDDSIARGNYPVDIHNPSGSGTVIIRIPANEYYTIPYRALIPLGIENLIVCGRPISSTHEAHSAYRVMPICCNIGESAGIAAAVAFPEGISFEKVDAKKIQAKLVQHGGLY